MCARSGMPPGRAHLGRYRDHETHETPGSSAASGLVLVGHSAVTQVRLERSLRTFPSGRDGAVPVDWSLLRLPRALRTSSLLQPSMSRNEITARWLRAARSIASSITAFASRPRSARPPARASGPRLPVARPARVLGSRKRSASTAASGTRPVVLQRRERKRAARRAGPASWRCSSDPEDPMRSERAALEAIEPSRHAEPQSPRHLFRGCLRRDVDPRHAHERGLVLTRTSWAKASSSPPAAPRGARLGCPPVPRGDCNGNGRSRDTIQHHGRRRDDRPVTT